MILLDSVSKKFSRFTALDSVSLEVKEGEAFALLGPNGAGKTTLVKILSTLLKPSSGAVKIAGFDAREEKEEVKKVIGVVSHNPFLYNELTARENLEFFAELFEVNPNIEELLAKVALEDKADVLVSSFSRGMKQRLAIARALIHNPKLLILDEPTSGLDITSRSRFYSLINSLRGGKTIFLTTHYLEEAELLCSRCAVINKGKIVEELETSDRKRLEEIFKEIERIENGD